MKIYVASSWRNERQQDVVRILRACGHEVYDFRNPPESTGFTWEEIDPDWSSWTLEQYAEALKHPRAIQAHGNDLAALYHCEACCLVLPSGRSASWEFGYAFAKGKRVVVFDPTYKERNASPELMYLGATFFSNILDLPRGFI